MICRFPIAAVMFAVVACISWPSRANAPEAPASARPKFIAGLAPYQRPQLAPMIRAFEPTPDWRARALFGVSEPRPASLGFLDRQGAWYTPFDRPGMPGYYDLRGWHSKAGETGRGR
jgi:hypothetical protein